MYRMRDSYTRAALIRALRRGVPVRILSEPKSRRDIPAHKAFEDAIRAAGGQVKWRVHAGLNHEKLMILHSQGMSIFMTNNMDDWPAAGALFYTQDAYVYQWNVQHFNRKWNSPTEFQ
jgi:hypothetical protein